MGDVMNSKFLNLLMIGFVCLLVWQLYESHQRELMLSSQLVKLEHQVEVLEARLAVADSAVAKLQEESLPGIVRKANAALLDAWRDVLDGIEKQVEESQRDLDQNQNESTGDEQGLKRI